PKSHLKHPLARTQAACRSGSHFEFCWANDDSMHEWNWRQRTVASGQPASGNPGVEFSTSMQPILLRGKVAPFTRNVKDSVPNSSESMAASSANSFGAPRRMGQPTLHAHAGRYKVSLSWKAKTEIPN